MADLAFPAADHGIMAIVRQAIAEDLGAGDLTTLNVVRAERRAEARIVSRHDLVVCGLPLFPMIVTALLEREKPDEEADSLAMVKSLKDGAHATRDETVCSVRGSARALLSFERIFLNFLAKLSGIATLTAAYVDEVTKAGARTRILDTRKTTPGYRLLEKYAVRAGGGTNHRMGLFDGVLIKDNHIAIAGGVFAALKAAKVGTNPRVQIEVECDTMAQVEEALRNGARAILLDNFTPAKVQEAAKVINGKARIEVSGGVTLELIQAYARAGADDISVGRLTHSAPAADLSMELVLK